MLNNLRTDSPRLPWLDACGCRIIVFVTFLRRMDNELKANFHTQMGRCWIQLVHLLDFVNQIQCLTAAANSKRLAYVVEFIHHIQELESAAMELPRFCGQVVRSHAMTLRLSIDDQPDHDQTPIHGVAKARGH